MNPRTSRLVITMLAVVCFGMLASVVYPVSPSTPQASQASGEAFSVGDHDNFSVSAEITVDGDPGLRLTGTVSRDGPRYRRVVDSGSTAEAYQAGPNETVYERYTIHKESVVDSHREAITGADDRTMLRQTDTAEGAVFVVRVNESFEFADELSGTASLFVSGMGTTSYDQVGRPSGTTIYEPQNGWFNGSRAYRITNASGEVRVDSETGVVDSGSVAWNLTEPADSYAHERFARLFSDQPERHRIDYEFETAGSNMSRPAWVPDE